MFWQPAHVDFKYRPSLIAILFFIAVAVLSAFFLYYVDGVFSKILFATTGIVPVFAIIAFDRQRQLDKALTEKDKR
ncbi:hypothetical protein HK19_15445 [Acetobacter persici]|uniref:hypothetical protein n=1 Tax=Acetobacter persici TaxID=1076596 RepID=UPI000A3A056A|nr:hypothetical protein [Acetobacter persici]OUI89040.1 hypothetical protein HK19_15445 [Acetobacter persici]